MRTEFGFTPRWTTAQAFDDYVRGRALHPIVGDGWVDTVERGALAAARVLR
jgi:UDP-glucose 4-epimerase